MEAQGLIDIPGVQGILYCRRDTCVSKFSISAEFIIAMVLYQSEPESFRDLNSPFLQAVAALETRNTNQDSTCGKTVLSLSSNAY